MTDSAQRPLLFLDVDGPLIPFGASSHQYPDGYPVYEAGYELKTASNPLLARIDPGHGPQLTALGCDLVWATTWMNEANECVSPRIGLPQIPVVIWPDPSDADDQDEQDGLHWKTRPLVAWAAGRSFAWVDDEVTSADRVAPVQMVDDGSSARLPGQSGHTDPHYLEWMSGDADLSVASSYRF